jgi:hypothetical protein
MAAQQRSIPLGAAGAALGAALGYLAGPTIPLVGGHLPLKDVATFGAMMGGLDATLFSSMATQAGAMFWGGAVLLGGIGFVVGRSMGSDKAS